MTKTALSFFVTPAIFTMYTDKLSVIGNHASLTIYCIYYAILARVRFTLLIRDDAAAAAAAAAAFVPYVLLCILPLAVFVDLHKILFRNTFERRIFRHLRVTVATAYLHTKIS